MTATDVRRAARQVIGDKVDLAEVILPAQGINNRTYFVKQSEGDQLVIKVRPGSTMQAARCVNSPQWPRYTQELLGVYPNGDLSTPYALT